MIYFGKLRIVRTLCGFQQTSHVRYGGDTAGDQNIPLIYRKEHQQHKNGEHNINEGQNVIKTAFSFIPCSQFYTQAPLLF